MTASTAQRARKTTGIYCQARAGLTLTAGEMRRIVEANGDSGYLEQLPTDNQPSPAVDRVARYQAAKAEWAAIKAAQRDRRRKPPAATPNLDRLTGGFFNAMAAAEAAADEARRKAEAEGNAARENRAQKKAEYVAEETGQANLFMAVA